MRKLKFVGGFLVFFILLFVNISYANIEVFSDYNTIMKINKDNTIDINKTLTIKNVYDVGIVPGQVEFKIGKGVDGSIERIEVMNISAYDAFGNEIKTNIRETNEYTTIVLNVYYPLLPSFEYQMYLNYKVKYKPNGIFFKSFEVPIRESTIPIQKGKFQVILPENYYFTFTRDDGTNVEINKNLGVWDIKDNNPQSIAFEYSYIPSGIGGMKGSYVFWISINIILFLILIYEIRREIKRIRAEYGND
jgi:hypothetical protein